MPVFQRPEPGPASLVPPSVQNGALVFGIVRRHGPVTKSDIARATALSPAAVSRVVGALESTGLIQPVGLAPSRGGRRATQYQVAADGGRVLAVDLSGYDLLLVELAADGTPLVTETYPLAERGEGLLPQVLDRVAEHASNVDAPRLLGVGVAVPGLLDRASGVLRHSIPLNWQGVPLRELLRSRLKTTVVIRKETEAAIRGEYLSYPGLPHDGLLYVRVAMGIGVGIFIKGDVYPGAHDMSGEVGHTIVDPAGPLCECGNRGCLEQVASVGAMMRDARRAFGDPKLDARSFFQQAAAGDRRALEVIHAATGHLARSLMNLSRLFDPGEVIIAGPFEDDAGIVFSEVVQELSRYAPLGGVTARVRPTGLGRLATPVGLCAEVVDQVLNQRLAVASTS